MQITIDQHEIERAIRQFIHNEGIDLTGQVVEIDFTLGKKPAGPRATIIIGAGEAVEEANTSTPDPEKEQAIPFTFTQTQEDEANE